MSTYTITTSKDNTGVAPPWALWSACFGEPDELKSYGLGYTEAEAIDDLLDCVPAPWEAK